MTPSDRCNFDCIYCHNEGLGDTRGPMEPSDDEMTADEIIRFLEVVEEFGIEKSNSPVVSQCCAPTSKRSFVGHLHRWKSR